MIYGYNKEAKTLEYIWAANDSSVLINALSIDDDFILSFVPKHWISHMENAGLQIRNAWHDYYIYDLGARDFSASFKHDLLRYSEIDIASEITLQCKEQSRGFTGQTPKWFYQWLNNSNIKDTAVLVSRTADDKITGLACVGLYGHDSSNGPIVWIKEVAASPSFQRRGIGKGLVSKALICGKERGARKAFLAVDEDNTNAIRLYKSLGFKPSKEDSEINMIKKR